MKWFDTICQNHLLYFYNKFLLSSFLKTGKIKTQIDVDLFTYIWLSKITQLHSFKQLA